MEVEKKTIYAKKIQHPVMDLFIAASDHGLVFVGTDHSSMEDLEANCIKQFHHCTFIYNDEKRLQPYIIEIVQYLKKERKIFSFPFDINGTPFQLKVWHALCNIPYGQTCTYSEIARQIQNPKGVRAVGGAVGSNPLSMIIPCHRVIGKNGALTGYSGGLDVKKKLLDLEEIPY